MPTTTALLDALADAVAGAEQLLILPHNDPDPDGIASALALQFIAQRLLNLPSAIVYRGMIGRAENRALVRYLGDPLRPLTENDLRAGHPLALIDTQPAAGNHALPPGFPVAIVIDHHPLRPSSTPNRFVDVRPELGATSTILTEYLQTAGLAPTTTLATALFYGIKADTMGLGRGASPADTAAYLYLQPRIDFEALAEIERAQVPAGYFKSFAAALRAARIYDDVLISYVGAMGYPDLAAEIADLLLRVQGVRWVICMGVYGQEMIVAVRTRSRQGGAGRLVQQIVAERGLSGGHGMLAAGHLPIGTEDPRRLARQLRQRALQTLGITAKSSGRRLV
jgi:nanoRNase/pAp phosphatase (c-di-AMP/oligoRNAs hydrolase)